MPAGRNLLSAPTYGSMTGRINWSRGMDERLARPSSAIFAPPVRAAAKPVATTTSGTPTRYGQPYLRGRMHNYNASEEI